MSDSTHPHSDIHEVRNEGFLGANLLLTQGWLLLDWMAEHRNRRRSPGWPEEPVLYILGRPSDVLFTSEDVDAAAEYGHHLAAKARVNEAVMEADRKHREREQQAVRPPGDGDTVVG